MSNIFNKPFEILISQKLKVVDKDTDRPWGGFFVISEDNAQEFSNIYFNALNTEEIKVSGKLPPKILIIASNKRLSWQYHHRRSEIWIHSDKDNPSDENDIVRIQDDFNRN